MVKDLAKGRLGLMLDMANLAATMAMYIETLELENQVKGLELQMLQDDIDYGSLKSVLRKTEQDLLAAVGVITTVQDNLNTSIANTEVLKGNIAEHKKSITQLENNLDVQEQNILTEGFSKLFHEYWNLEKAQEYLQTKKRLMQTLRGIGSKERAISIDLLTTGIVTGIYQDETTAIADIKQYWRWLNGEIEVGESPLRQLLSGIVELEKRNALNGNVELFISNQTIKLSCDVWYQQGQLLDKPTSKIIQSTMNELGFRLAIGGRWIKM